MSILLEHFPGQLYAWSWSLILRELASCLIQTSDYTILKTKSLSSNKEISVNIIIDFKLVFSSKYHLPPLNIYHCVGKKKQKIFLLKIYCITVTFEYDQETLSIYFRVKFKTYVIGFLLLFEETTFLLVKK